MRALLRLAVLSGLLLTLAHPRQILAQPPPVAAITPSAEVEYFAAQQVQVSVSTKIAIVRPVEEAPRPMPAVVVDTQPAAMVEGRTKFRGPPVWLVAKGNCTAVGTSSIESEVSEVTGRIGR